MQIILNGTPREIGEATTIAALIDAERLAGKRLAVEVNGVIVPRSRHIAHRLDPEDRVEIVQAIGGG